MLFTELRFLPFFLLVFGVHWLLRANTARKAWLLLASWAFYGAWDERFLVLIWVSTLLDYTVGLRLGATSAARTRKRLMAVSLVGNLGLLGFFKYFGFFVDSAVAFLAQLGFHAERPVLAIVLPVGISFYTFQTLSYAIDVYRGVLAPRRSLLDFALFVAFFPQLVAGPIVRAAEFLPALDAPRRWKGVDVRAALVLFLVGFFKKACVSDNLAPLVEQLFAAPEHFGALSTWIGVGSYAVQIYCDFSGYSDMAIACAALLGHRLPQNFAHPYLAAGVVDFWRRWHMSLSSWLRDYLYVSLGGNRRGRARTYRNLMLTMLLGGLWHGAGWNFVIWGGLHGAALCVQRALGGRVERWPRLVLVPLTFLFTCFCWVFFRAPDLESARAVLVSAVGGVGAIESSLDGRLLWALGALAVLHVAAASGRLDGWWRRGPSWVFAGGYGIAVALAVPFLSVDFTPFIYFQF